MNVNKRYFAILACGAIALGMGAYLGSIDVLAAQEKSKKAEQQNSEKGQKGVKLAAKLSDKKARLLGKSSTGSFATTITGRVINESSQTLTQMRFGFQDSSGSGDPVTAEIDFGSVSAGATETMTTTLPTGFEVVLISYYAGGELYSAAGFGVNALEVELTVTD